MRDKTLRAEIIGHADSATCKYLHPSSTADTHYSKDTNLRARNNDSSASVSSIFFFFLVENEYLKHVHSARNICFRASIIKQIASVNLQLHVRLVAVCREFQNTNFSLDNFDY